MAENGNRGPNDSLRRAGKRRREPPIIDAAAIEVPLDPTTPAASDTSPVPDPHQPSGAPTATQAAAGVEATPPEAPATAVEIAPSSDGTPSVPDRPSLSAPAEDEPVLFGNARRDPAWRSATAGESWTLEGPPTGVAASEASETAAHADRPAADEPTAAGPNDPIAGDDAHPTPGAVPMPPPRARSAAGALAGVLGVAAVVLLGIISWLVYAGGQRGGDLAATVADLKTKVATLEARPDPTALQSQMTALDKRVSAADADRAALAKTVADLSSRLAGQQAQATKPAEPAATPAPATAAFATLGVVAALAARIEGLDGRLTALSSDQSGTAKALAALPKPIVPDFGPINGKVAALENQINAVDTKINGSDARLNGFDAKVNAVDGKINGFDAKINGFDAKMNGLVRRLNGVEVKVDDAASQTAKLQTTVTSLPKVDLGPLQSATVALDGRIAKIEGQLSAPKDGARVTDARAVGTADETKATPIALVGQSIERAVADGRPYPADVAALKALGAEPDLVAKLERSAAGGLPDDAALKARWDGVRGAVLAAVKPAEASGNAFDRLVASATSVVQVHRVGAVTGDDPAAVVSQIDAAVEAGDGPAALAAWDKLPEAGQTPSRAWADAERSRVDALAAARDLVDRAIATLGRSKS